MTTEGTASLEELARKAKETTEYGRPVPWFPRWAGSLNALSFANAASPDVILALLERQRALETALREAEEWIAKRKALNHASRDRYRAAHPEVHRKSARESMARTRARARAALLEPLP